ncbi:conjugal transfer protein TraT [Pseudomonas syringae group genomosp. 3]|uniref:conjugal transfer protein TraT n=1 Tax=Pseudomonas syringae group genomosp. 3 TaxID=251701 RepID=UPI001FBB8C99|nr:conjugal transfer protein TraT [Pseudomonas syringae group genomosp. 3]
MQSDAIVMHDEDSDQESIDSEPRSSVLDSTSDQGEENSKTFRALALDISGDEESPRPVQTLGQRCDCCALHTSSLWQGARSGCAEPHSVCTLCYLTGHLDSPTAAHGRLAFLPDLPMTDAIHLQRRALLAILGGNKAQMRQGKRVWAWMNHHSREVEVAWGTARAGEFAQAMKRLPPNKRGQLQARLTGCVLIVPADMFDDLTLLLPSDKTVQSVLSSRSWGTYTRSDLYV